MIRDDSLCQLTGRTAIDGRVRVRRLLDGARAGVHWEACPEGPVWIDALDALTEMPLRRPARFTRIQGLEKERARGRERDGCPAGESADLCLLLCPDSSPTGAFPARSTHQRALLSESAQQEV